MRTKGRSTRAPGKTVRVATLIAAGLCACARPHGKSSEPAPDPAERADVVRLRYAESAELTQVTSFSVEQAGGGAFGRVSLDLQARVGWISREGQREVSWAVVAADDVELHGTLAIDPDDDPVTDLLTHGEGAYLVDPLGERDDVATSRLRANEAFHRAVQSLHAAEGTAPARAKLLSLLPVALALPELPPAELVVGERTTLEEAQEVELEGDGLVMPATVTRAYTLVKLDRAGAAPIAEVTIEIVSSGLLELPDATLSIEGTAHGTLLFDVARGLPVMLELSRTEMFDFGGKVGESTTIIATTWDG